MVIRLVTQPLVSLLKNLVVIQSLVLQKHFQNLLGGNYGLSKERYKKLVKRMVDRIDRYVLSIPETPNTEDYQDS